MSTFIERMPNQEPFIMYDCLGNIVDKPTERWFPIKGYEGLYLFSTEGRIKGLDRYIKRSRGGFQLKKGQIIKTHPIKKGGYVQVHLSKNGKAETLSVHKIMCESILDRPHGFTIDHMNQDCQDNRIDNLRYCTYRDNLANRKKISACGFVGVSLNPPNYKKRFRARIRIGYKMKELGNYETAEEASKAYQDEKNKLENK